MAWAFLPCSRRRTCSVRKPAQREIAVESTSREPEAVAPPRELLGHFLLRGDYRAADHIAVAIDVLRGRVHDDIGTQFDRPLPAGRQEGVVGDHQRANRVPALRDVGDIGDAQQRIAGRFDPDQRRGLRQCGGDRGRIAEVDELHGELTALLPRRQQTERAAITVVRRDDTCAHGQDMPHERDGAHARPRDDSPGSAFEIIQRIGEQIARWISRTAVVVLALLAKGAKGIGGREMQRRHHRASHIAIFEAGAYRAGIGCQRGSQRSRHGEIPGLSFSTLAKIGASRRFSLRKASCP